MSVLSIAVGSWIGFNGAVFAGLMLRRDRPEVRERLFRWVVKGARRRPTRSAGRLTRG